MKLLTLTCSVCHQPYVASRSDQKFCTTRCANKYHNSLGKRLSLKLTPEEREIILGLQDYFIRRRETNG